jgi:hypothetical protein
MWYMPYMRVRHAVLIYVCLAIGISLVAIALRFAPGTVHVHALHVHVQSDQSYVDVSMLLSGAAALVGGFATVLGLNLAAENDGHLELAWTKPVSREGYALGVFAVDIAAMAACILFTALCAAVVVDVYAGYQAVVFGESAALLSTFAFCGLPLLVYAWIAALSASLKRNRGTIAGIFWPLMIVLGLLQSLPVPAVHGVVSTLNLLNPIAVFTAISTPNGNGPGPSVWTFAWGWLIAALLLTAALFQWRRLEL